MRTVAALVAALVLCGIVRQADAQVSVVFGGEVVGPPASVLEGALVHDSLVRAFEEKKGVVLPIGLPVIATLGPHVGPEPFTHVVPAGTIVDSYLLHSDPTRDDPLIGTSYSAAFFFANPIYGLIAGDPDLTTTDPILGLAGTVYGPEAARGMEAHNPFDDGFEISPDRHFLRVRFLTFTAVDQLRVVTRSNVPEPGTWALLAGLGGAAALAGRRKR